MCPRNTPPSKGSQRYSFRRAHRTIPVIWNAFLIRGLQGNPGLVGTVSRVGAQHPIISFSRDHRPPHQAKDSVNPGLQRGALESPPEGAR